MNTSINLQDFIQVARYTRKIEKGNYLFQEGQKAEELFVVLKGKIQISKMVPDGRELTIRMCSTGELIGEIPLFCASPKYMLDAKIVEDGEVAVIHKGDLEERLSNDHALSLQFMKWLNGQHRRNQTKFRDLILHGKKGALYSTLIRLCNSYGIVREHGIVIDQPLTNQEIANFCGTSREVANRLLSELRKNNIISIDKGIITIHNLTFLRDEIDCEDCPIDICKID
ncbi:Crp/Fnr family transcriptional regulator [Robertmurraya korlensis]|uniref:Crp/Fnr family transcriptional regulator n=1 Tax=Robertmurraya korlensis TaxID=519977 RepID=UPI0020405C37|nr:Crp/Fnr family transcriptional regulator [Robertmurraya korlensis]MCM3602389.1 Crp/Fnr family transcriptional regulator [Robertmurraya korlensis]